MSSSKVYTVIAQSHPESDEVFIQLPPELLASEDWREGDQLSYEEVEKDGIVESIHMINVSKKQRQEQSHKGAPKMLFEVETLITHRVRYAVMAISKEQAEAAVLPEETQALEFDQNCIGKQIFVTREITQSQYLADKAHLGTQEHALKLIHQAEEINLT